MSDLNDLTLGATAGTGEDVARAAPGGRVIETASGEVLTEVVVSDEVPDDMSEMDELESVLDDEHGMEEVDPSELEADDLGPAGAIEDQSIYTFAEHTDSVYCVAMHPTIPGLVVTGGGDDKAFLWRYDVLSSPPLLSSIPLEHPDSVINVGYNFDGKHVMTGGFASEANAKADDSLVRVWDVGNGAPVCRLVGPSEDVEWCQWHSKGNAVVAGSKDSTVWMWLTGAAPAAGAPPGEGQCVQVFAGHDGAVTAGCFSSDGKTVCSGGEDGTVRVWAPKTGVCKHTFQEHTGHSLTVTSCVSSPLDPALILSASMDGTVLLLHIGTMKVLQKFVHSTKALEAQQAQQSMDVDEDEAQDNYDAPVGGAGDEGGVIMGSVECIGFCPLAQFKFAASGGVDGDLKVWDMITGQLRCVCAHGDTVSAMKWHASAPLVATSSGDLALRLWDVRSGSCLRSFTGHSALITGFDMRSLPEPAVLPAPVSSSAITESESSLSSDLPPAPPAVPASAPGFYTDVIVSVSDDNTAKVFVYNAAELLA